jgi:hypothetical protein
VFVKPCVELTFVKLKEVCIANKDEGLNNIPGAA